MLSRQGRLWRNELPDSEIYGFEILVLWEKEMDDEELIADKIRLFCDES
jgi:hypothetical protein